VTALDPATASGAGAVETVAESVATIVSAHDGVARLAAGRFGEVATYLPGRRITGVRVSDDDVEVHIVARNVPLPRLGRDVSAAVAAVAGPRRVTVFVDDIDFGEDRSGEDADRPDDDTADRPLTNFEI
jgi:hypothetical protein